MKIDRPEYRNRPSILAPAGDRESFLAALAAGADAVYCGLKIFSARMEADNFGMEELAGLTALARTKGVEVYVAFNSMIKAGELDKTLRILKKLCVYVNPHGLIVQDLGMLSLSRQAGFKGQIHLSTLANASFGQGLSQVKALGIDRVVLPRELTVDEIKSMAEQAPRGLDLEVFIHGALCYAVSGRCYWSSWFGGKSGLRGRCVQPCRRVYAQNREKSRFFSCMDLSVDVLVKVLKEIPQVTTWKIEGRKKGPHYVFYTVKAYQILRDEGHDPQKRKTALAFLDYAMGRPSTHYNFLPQRKINPVNKDSETGSGLFAGRVRPGPSPYFITREALFGGDLLRLGYEDHKGHSIQRVNRPVPKKGKFVLKKDKYLSKGTPVFIVDRKEPEIMEQVNRLERELEAMPKVRVKPQPSGASLKPPAARQKRPARSRERGPVDVCLTRNAQKKKSRSAQAVWLSMDRAVKMPGRAVKEICWWLPPAVWPDRETDLAQAIGQVMAKGGRKFVLNMIWQKSLFPEDKSLDLWAGPFNNLANAAAVNCLKPLGFSGAVVSPELGGEQFMQLPKETELPLGVVVKGNWPLCVSRSLSTDIRLDTPFSSPMGEAAWVTRRDGDFWVFPAWPLDLTSKEQDLKKAGYQMLITMEEPVPKGVVMKRRQGLWNWNLSVL